MTPTAPDYTAPLRSLMQQAEIPSFRALSRVAGVSSWQVEQLRRGQAAQMRLEPLLRLSRALQISLPELLAQCSALELTSPVDQAGAPPEVSALQHEYHRLQQQLSDQRQQLWHEFQQASLQTLEMMVRNLPTAIYAAQQNADLPASRLLPLLRPLDQLLHCWGIEAIAPVGAEVPYDPHVHDLNQGQAQPGDRVRVRYVGYRQGDRLLYRAKVSLVEPTSSE